MKAIIILISLMVSPQLFADVKWQTYSDQSFKTAIDAGKQVVLGFHKKGCGTCYAQDTVLEETGVTKNKNVVFLKVERKNKAHDKTYVKYGLSQRQWAALILADKKGEIYRVNPGDTNKERITTLAKKAI